MCFFKQNRQRVSSILLILAGALILSALHWFAPVCTKQIVLFNKAGDEILKPMACNHTADAAQIIAYILVALGIDAWFSSKIRISAIAIGIILFILPMHADLPCAMGICKMDMPCHTTAIWLRIAGGISILAGILNLIGKRKQPLA